MPTAEPLTALAHPMRGRILGELRRRGTATATDLAAALGTNTGATSYHVRRLHDAGLVSDTGSGTGRRRVWAPVDSGSAWPIGAADSGPDMQAVLGWLARDHVRHFGRQYERWLDVAADWPPDWQGGAGADDAGVLVTADQLLELRRELTDLLARYRRLGQGNPRARRVAAYLFCYPLDLDRPPQPNGPTP
ncbi:MAG: helix-turn-helix transcriptional regulator [Dermatophilaceae bacterium]